MSILESLRETKREVEQLIKKSKKSKHGLKIKLRKEILNPHQRMALETLDKVIRINRQFR